MRSLAPLAALLNEVLQVISHCALSFLYWMNIFVTQKKKIRLSTNPVDSLIKIIIFFLTDRFGFVPFLLSSFYFHHGEGVSY